MNGLFSEAYQYEAKTRGYTTQRETKTQHLKQHPSNKNTPTTNPQSFSSRFRNNGIKTSMQEIPQKPRTIAKIRPCKDFRKTTMVRRYMTEPQPFIAYSEPVTESRTVRKAKSTLRSGLKLREGGDMIECSFQVCVRREVNVPLAATVTIKLGRAVGREQRAF